MALITPDQQTSLFVLVALVGLVVVLFFGTRVVRRLVAAAAIQGGVRRSADDDEAGGDLPGPWQALRVDVEMSNRVLARPVFERARQIFLDHYAGAATPASLTREYDAREEFLLVLDEQGLPFLTKREMLDLYHKTVAAHPQFDHWFREELLEGGEFSGTPVLLAARWLCHLVGLRHGTVEIFIDPPDRPGYTLVQVRGMSKFEAPGAFDIPCAGHIDGVDSAEASLAKELSEELNLGPGDLEDLRLVARYNSFSAQAESSPASPSVNNEHRVLYRAQLKPEAASRIQFTDGEVAGLIIFAVGELRALVQKYPQRVASGLSDAIGFYE
ncbi:MAG TPA: NUDIX domain-containing protein [Anaerolineaceae bacterium]